MIKRLEIAEGRFRSKVGAEESRLAQYIPFDFSLQYQPSDGWVIVDDNANNAPLDVCLNVIQRKGILTLEDYLQRRI